MVYLDYNATTPVDPRVIEAMIPVFSELFGNPSSTTHGHGLDAMRIVDAAREQVAAILGRDIHDVVFTSGATEANNMVVHGLSSHEGMFLVGATEHKSVLEAYNNLENVNVMTVPVTRDGVTDLDKLAGMMNKNVVLVSVMAANSETGVIQPVSEISKIVHENDALFHCDATQYIGRIPFDANALGVDIVTLSSHKIYGPKGIGAMVATADVRRRLRPLIHGGGQENGMRSGTMNVPGIVGFGKACEIATDFGLADASRQTSLRDHFEKEVLSLVDDVTVNGGEVRRLPNTSNLRIAGAFADAVIVNAPAIEISTGSACSSSAIEPSHVLTAMGLDRDAADESIRMSLGRPTTHEEVDVAVWEIARAVAFVRGKEAELADWGMI